MLRNVSRIACRDLFACRVDRPGGARVSRRADLSARTRKHNHAPGIVECPNGDLLVSWYRGSGERSADDVAVLGSRLTKGQSTWSEPFVMADNPGLSRLQHLHDDRQAQEAVAVLADHSRQPLGIGADELSHVDRLSRARARRSGTGRASIWLKPADFKDKAMSLLHERPGQGRPQAPAERAKAYAGGAGKTIERKAVAAAGLAAALQADGAFDRPHPAAAL